MKLSESFKLALPLVLGYFPIAITFGLLGFQQGLGFFPIFLFSNAVFAGSAQFAALGMLASGTATIGQAFIATFLINLRHFILSLAYIPNTKEWTTLQKLRFFPILTDENFAVLMSQADAKRNPSISFRVSQYAYWSWSIGTMVGFYFGKLIPDPNRFGLDFALSALFIGIIVLFINRFEQIATLIAAIVFMSLFYFVFDFGRLSVIASAILASLVGWRLECYRKST